MEFIPPPTPLQTRIETSNVPRIILLGDALLQGVKQSLHEKLKIEIEKYKRQMPTIKEITKDHYRAKDFLNEMPAGFGNNDVLYMSFENGNSLYVRGYRFCC